MVFVLLSIAALLFVPAAHADFYKYVNKDGIECYTNAPASRKAVLVLRESRTRVRAAGNPSAVYLPACGRNLPPLL